MLIEVEHDGDPPYEAWLDALEACGALIDDTILAEDATGLRRLQAIRHAIPASVNEQVVRNGMPKVGTDFAVPDTALAQILAVYGAEALPHVCFGHIGDNHLHLNFLPRSSDELAERRQRGLGLSDLDQANEALLENPQLRLFELTANQIGSPTQPSFGQIQLPRIERASR